MSTPAHNRGLPSAILGAATTKYRVTMYDLEAMKKAVERCDENIRIFEAAIDRELVTKREYKHIVSELELQQETDE